MNRIVQFFILQTLFVAGIALGHSLLLSSDVRAHLVTAMEFKEEPLSSELSEPMIEELKKIFAAHEEREKKSFSEKWPVRFANVAVRGLLPSVGINLFTPYDPLMPPTLGATFISRD